MTKIVEFKDLAYLHSIRNDHLNPLIRRVENEIVPAITELETHIHETVRDVTLDIPTKVLTVDKGAGGHRTIDLKPIMPEFPGIGVQNQQGVGPSAGIKLVQFPDATITVLPSGKDAVVGFDWESVFNHNQKWPTAVVEGTTSPLKSIIFTGDPDAVKTQGTNVTVRIPKAEALKVSIPAGSPAIRDPVDVKEIQLTGEVDGSTIVDGKLTLKLNAGGGGGGSITNQNFKGFFESLGDIQSFVTDPIDGKSYAFAKDSTLGGKYYTPYFYVNGAWTELKQDPALTYNAPSASTNQGVFSIKPNEKIIIDMNGQLNLDGLSTPALPRYFEGFFDSLDALKGEVPRPVLGHSFAYVKGPGGGWLNYRAETLSNWRVVAPLGSFSYVDEATSSYSQVFGIKKNDAWIVDSKGLLDLRGGGSGGASLKASVGDYQHIYEEHDIKSISFIKSKSMAEFSGANNDQLHLSHPQRVVNYNATWESNHNTQDYEGNVFYDETSRTWMGWGIPKTPGAVDAKWTRIAHPRMSDEVKDLTRRLPAKAPSVVPGLIGDNVAWDHIGVTFIEAGNNQLPAELKGACGGYVTTVVQDKDTAGVTIPQYRMQTLLADREEGGTWIRRLLATGSPGSAISWSPWVKSSFGRDDIIKHEKDPNAHKSVMKFYRIYSVQGNVWELHNQEQGGVKGILREGNRSLLADTYGATDQAYDYGTVPYEGNFKGNGVIEFSGYNGTATALGKWTVKVRLKKNGTSAPVDVYTGYYTHLNDKERFPPLKFSVASREASIGDQILIHVYFDNPVGLKNKQEHLYICPVKSYIVFQDAETVAGSQIATSFRNLLGRVDSFGDVGIRVHHNEYATNKNVRVYGVIANSSPIELKPS